MLISGASVLILNFMTWLKKSSDLKLHTGQTIRRDIAPELFSIWNNEKKRCMFEVLKARSCKTFRDTLTRTHTYVLGERTSDYFWCSWYRHLALNPVRFLI